MMSKLFSQIEYYILYSKYTLIFYISDFKRSLEKIYGQGTGIILEVVTRAEKFLLTEISALKLESLHLSIKIHAFIQTHRTVILISMLGYISTYFIVVFVIKTIRNVRYKSLIKKNTFLSGFIKKIKTRTIKRFFTKEFYVELKQDMSKFFSNLIVEALFSIEARYGHIKLFNDPEYTYRYFSKIFYVFKKAVDIAGILIEKGLIALKIIQPRGTDENLFLTTEEKTDEEHLQRVIPDELQNEFHLTGEKQLNEYIDFINVYKKPLITAFEKWKDGSLNSMLFIGKKGCGKSAIIDLLMQKIDREKEIIKITVNPDEYRKQIIDDIVIKISSTSSIDKAKQTFKQSEQDLIIILDNIHLLFFKDHYNFDRFTKFLSMISNSGNKVLWIATINEFSYRFISQVIPINDTFDFKINLNFMKAKDIKNIFIKKAESHGYSIYPRLSEEQVKIARKKIKKGEITYADLPNYILNEYFGKLVDNCHNVFPSLYHYFLRSISYVRNKRIYISEANFRDIGFAQDFSNDYYFILVAMMTHEILTKDEMVFLLNIDKNKLDVYLSFLLKHRLIETTEINEKCFYRLDPVHHVQMGKILKSKNFMYF